MKAIPVILESGKGYVECRVEDATHIRLHIPGPTKLLTLPIIRHGTREGTGCWSWNGCTEKPTLRPSILTEYKSALPNESWRCHSWINDGNVQFLPDCSHELSGSTVSLIEF